LRSPILILRTTLSWDSWHSPSSWQSHIMPGLCGVISIWGDIKWAFDCDRESCEIADKLTAPVEFQELKQATAIGRVARQLTD
jgi:hypothetical protein